MDQSPHNITPDSTTPISRDIAPMQPAQDGPIPPEHHPESCDGLLRSGVGPTTTELTLRKMLSLFMSPAFDGR